MALDYIQYTPEASALIGLQKPQAEANEKNGSKFSASDLKQANSFFEHIKEKERANSKLPNISFDVVEKGSGEHKTYVLNENQKPGKSTKVTRPEIGSFHIDSNGNVTTKEQEFFINGQGALNIRQTDQFKDASTGRVTTKIFEGPAPEKNSPSTKLHQLSETVTSKTGEEISSTKFSYSENKVSETIVEKMPDGSSRKQVFEGTDADKLKPISQVINGKDGTIVSTTYSYADGKVKQTVDSRNADGSSSTQVFEGTSENNLSLISHTSRTKDGQVVFSTKLEHKGDGVSQTLMSREVDGSITNQVLEGTNKDNLKLKSEVKTHPDGSSESTSFEYSGNNTIKTVVVINKEGATKKQVFSGEGENLKPTLEVVSTKTGEQVYSSSFDYSGGKVVQTVTARDLNGVSKTQVIEGEDAQRRLRSEIIVAKDGTELQKISMEDIRNSAGETIGRRQTLTKRGDGNSHTVSIFEGSSEQNMQPKRVTFYDANGTETKRATFESIVDSDNHVIGQRQTVVTHTDRNTLTTSIFEGKANTQLKEKERIITGSAGKVIKHYVANDKGELVETYK